MVFLLVSLLLVVVLAASLLVLFFIRLSHTLYLPSYSIALFALSLLYLILLLCLPMLLLYLPMLLRTTYSRSRSFLRNSCLDFGAALLTSSRSVTALTPLSSALLLTLAGSWLLFFCLWLFLLLLLR